MDRERTRKYTYYLLDRKEVGYIRSKAPEITLFIPDRADGGRRIIYPNSNNGKYGQAQLEGLIVKGGFKIVDTLVPRASK